MNFDFELSTSNGEVSISGLPVNLTISEDKRKIGTMGVGGNVMDVYTSNGDIQVLQLEID